MRSNNDLPKTFQMRLNPANTEDQRIARFLHDYPYSKTQKVKEIILMYLDGQLSLDRGISVDSARKGDGRSRA